MNPMTYLDAILSDYATPKVRRLVHSILLLTAVLVTIVLSVDGDWKKALIAFAATIYAGANHANTPAPDDTVGTTGTLEVSGNAETLEVYEGE